MTQPNAKFNAHQRIKHRSDAAIRGTITMGLFFSRHERWSYGVVWDDLGTDQRIHTQEFIETYYTEE